MGVLFSKKVSICFLKVRYKFCKTFKFVCSAKKLFGKQKVRSTGKFLCVLLLCFLYFVLQNVQSIIFTKQYFLFLSSILHKVKLRSKSKSFAKKIKEI